MTAGIRLTAALFAIVVPQGLRAQGILDQFSYEGMRFSGVGIEFGAIASDRVQSTVSPAVRVDHGFIAPRVRVLTGLSWFRSDFNADEIGKFEASLRRVVVDPSNDFDIVVGTIRWSHLVADLDLQYMIPGSESFVPFIGLGVGLHWRNGSGAAIDGTFVEDALDTVAGGVNASVGALIKISGQLYLSTDVRGVLTDELRSIVGRGGLMIRIPQATPR